MKTIIPLSILVLVGFCGVAVADSRNDVLERLAHCNALPDGRAWLDCYYAAAQPQRAALGLPSAPQASAYESLFNRSGPIGSGVATAPTSVVPAIAGGAGETHDSGPLGIFDTYSVPPEQFGLTNARPGPGQNVDRIVDRLASYTFAGGKFTVTLANGQVWQQIAGPRANWRSTPANYTATVTHGALRTFNLRVQDGPNAENILYKVERIH